MDTAVVTQVVKPSTLERLKKNYQVNKPKYLLGATYVGVGLTAASGVYTGLKMPSAIAKAKDEVKKDDKWYKKFWKYFKHIAPIAAPTVLSATGTIMSAKGMYKELGHRLSVVSAAYTAAVAETDLLKKKVEEVGGKKVAEKVKQAVKEEEVKDKEFPEDKAKLEKQRETSPNSQSYDGSKLPYYDPMLQCIHWATKETMLKIQSRMLAAIRSSDDETVDMSIFYEELGYDGYNKKVPEFAYDYVWTKTCDYDLQCAEQNIDKAFFNCDYTTVTHDGIPCKYIDFHEGMAMKMHVINFNKAFPF